MRTARIVALVLLCVALVALVVLGYHYGGAGPAVSALLGGLGLGYGLVRRGRAGVRGGSAAVPRPDLGGHIAAVDEVADDDTEAAIAAAALGIARAVQHADDIRADAGPGNAGVASDDTFLRDELGAVEWRPPVDPSAPTQPD